jgi:hypothetical protein
MLVNPAPFRQRRWSFWCRTFELARSRNDWSLVARSYTRSTAAQLASDIKNAHRREDEYQRVRGIVPGELWQARWEPANDGAAGRYVVWIRPGAGEPEA